MGVPAFFRWLAYKYPSVVVKCIEEQPRDVNGQLEFGDSSLPNPNGVEFDNLYLDLNGIIHPCTHPENKPPPKCEAEMMLAIFDSIDRLFRIVRPRKLLYMAIDGVAPRAKMNQQRSRRFRASKEAQEKSEEVGRIRSELIAKNAYPPSNRPQEDRFDSNCITPGTLFMDRLNKSLHYYIHDRLHNDPGWKGIKVILSDANVPGEGEHKIMDYIRRQRGQPDHDPNTKHILCGADADLIMLGLATHEPHFTIIREEFKPYKPRPCDVCGLLGHEMKDCKGITEEEILNQTDPDYGQQDKFVFVRLSVLREYLRKELRMPTLPFPYDFERALDDWVFMCFFVGNDFLPHLPSIEIREKAIDRLVELYKDCVYETNGWLTDAGEVNLERVQKMMVRLGEMECEIFMSRHENDLKYGNTETANSVVFKKKRRSHGRKRSASAAGLDNDDQLQHDTVRLWENGFKERYYVNKFHVAKDNLEFRTANELTVHLVLGDFRRPWTTDSLEEYSVAREYVRGLCWVLRYYYQGCPSWKWYFPYHYAPFASDFVDIHKVTTHFENGTQPFRPLEQLMGVFPAASSLHVPRPWAKLMNDPYSPIIDFYPTDFRIDLNGKKFAWQGVALLPFVDEQRLIEALEPLYGELTMAEKIRNLRGYDRLYVCEGNESHARLVDLYRDAGENFKSFVRKNRKYSYRSEGVRGVVMLSVANVGIGGQLPGTFQNLPPITNNKVVCVRFLDVQYPAGFVFSARKLRNAESPPRTLRSNEFCRQGNRNWRQQRGTSLKRNREDARDRPEGAPVAQRVYSSVPPTPQLQNGADRSAVADVSARSRRGKRSARKKQFDGALVNHQNTSVQVSPNTAESVTSAKRPVSSQMEHRTENNDRDVIESFNDGSRVEVGRLPEQNALGKERLLPVQLRFGPYRTGYVLDQSRNHKYGVSAKLKTNSNEHRNIPKTQPDCGNKHQLLPLKMHRSGSSNPNSSLSVRPRRVVLCGNQKKREKRRTGVIKSK